METICRIKKGVDEREWDHLHPKVHQVAETLCYLLDRMGFDPEITSMIRPHAGDSGVHATGRAVDIVPRVRGTGKSPGIVSTMEMQKIAAAINIIYKRNDQKLTCIYHNSGTGMHFHLQVAATKDWKDLAGKIEAAHG